MFMLCVRQVIYGLQNTTVVATLHRDHILDWFGVLLEVIRLSLIRIQSQCAAQPGLSVNRDCRQLNLWAPVPPTREQKAISKHVGAATVAVEDTVKATEREIELA